MENSFYIVEFISADERGIRFTDKQEIFKCYDDAAHFQSRKGGRIYKCAFANYRFREFWERV